MIQRSQIKQYVKVLARRFRPERVILFGSYAKGRPGRDSDVDLLVIMDHDKKKNVEQVIDIRRQMDAPFPMDLLIRKPAEFLKRISMKDMFLTSIMEDGQILYERHR